MASLLAHARPDLAIGNNKFAPFSRELANIYTRGTFIDDLGGGEEDEAFGDARDNYLMCVNEELPNTLNDEKTRISLIVSAQRSKHLLRL